MIKNKLLQQFLAVGRIKELNSSLLAINEHDIRGSVDSARVLSTVIISVLPVVPFYLTLTLSPSQATTIFIGLAAIVGILFRIKSGIPYKPVVSWAKSLRLTHTAFALGCIPAVIVMFTHPQALYFVQSAQSGSTIIAGPGASTSSLVTFVLGVSIWAGLSEEIIYRGLLVSVVRRWRILNSQRARDTLAVLLGAIIFSIVHLPTWGLPMTIALAGLGIGFGIAYIAIGEQLLPLIIYHIAFDILSLTWAVYTYRTL